VLYLVLPFLVPFAFLFAMAALCVRLRALRRAQATCARRYWACIVAAHAALAYGVLLLTVLTIDMLSAGRWGVPLEWPAFASLWSSSGNRTVLLLLDVASALLLSLTAAAAAARFGYVNAANVWHPPRRRDARRGREAMPGLPDPHPSFGAGAAAQSRAGDRVERGTVRVSCRACRCQEAAPCDRSARRNGSDC